MAVNLFKKDFLLIKRNIIATVIILALLPLLMGLDQEGLKTQIDTIGFIYVGFFIMMLLTQHLALKDYQFPKAEAMVCTMPYSRKQIVIARYLFCFSITLFIDLLFCLEVYLLYQMNLIRLESMSLFIFISALYLSFYFPIQYRYGYEKTRFIFLVGVIALSVGINSIPIELLYFNFSNKQLMFLLLGLSIVMLILSVTLSIKIYENKDL